MTTVLEVHAAAQKLGVSTRMMHFLIENGVIPAIRTAGKGYKLVNPADLEGLEITYPEIEALIKSKRSSHTATSRKEHDHEPHSAKA